MRSEEMFARDKGVIHSFHGLTRGQIAFFAAANAS